MNIHQPHRTCAIESGQGQGQARAESRTCAYPHCDYRGLNDLTGT